MLFCTALYLLYCSYSNVSQFLDSTNIATIKMFRHVHCIHMCIYIYIYIYIERERERFWYVEHNRDTAFLYACNTHA